MTAVATAAVPFTKSRRETPDVEGSLMRRSCRCGEGSHPVQTGGGRTLRPRDERRNCNSLYFVVRAQTRKKTFGAVQVTLPRESRLLGYLILPLAKSQNRLIDCQAVASPGQNLGHDAARSRP